MIKISCYQTPPALLAKTFCKLAEKCYYSSKRTCVITNNNEFTRELDRVLWTYSKKHFIPHATSEDPLSEKQPVYITDSFENLSSAGIFILVNPDTEKILKLLSLDHFIHGNSVDKLLILFDDAQKIHFMDINNLINKSYIKSFEIDFFELVDNGGWRESYKA
jgi:DNA polymerase IIIc chi subunit